MNINLIKSDNSMYYELEIKRGKCKISYESLPKILHIKHEEFNWDFKPSWFIHNTGYVMCTIPASETNESGNNIYMHRYLMDEYSNDRQKTIDHKNQDKTDNRLENLHLVNQSFQNHNRKRKERKEILIPGFETSIKLPEYISYIKEPKIKDTDKKNSLSTLPAHFLVESSLFGFSKHATKSNKITIKERLYDALIIRHNLIIDKTPDITILFIDSIKFNNIYEFEKHNIKLINNLCDITITKIPRLNLNYKKSTKLPKSNVMDLVLNDSISIKDMEQKDKDNTINCLKDNTNEQLIHDTTLYNYLEEIVDSRINKKNRLIKNCLDLYIIRKLNSDIDKFNKSVASKVLNISDDYIARVLKNEINLRYTIDIPNTFINSKKFIEEYNIIKNEIIEKMKTNTLNQLSGLKNNQIQKKINRDWKISIDTIIEMVKDKQYITYKEIAEKYKDIDGNSITQIDVQNICSDGRSYWLDESDFINRTDITFEEYKLKRKLNVRHITPKNTNSHNLINTTNKSNLTKHQELCKTNSLSKRTCTSITLIQIFKDKYTILTAQKTALKYKNKMDETVSECLVKQIWTGSTSLFEDDFINQTDITYQQYLEDVKKEKTEFSRPLEYKKKFDEIIDGIDKKTIKELNRTHIKTLKMVGKDDTFINNLRKQIKTL
jgi:hypothetical protein